MKAKRESLKQNSKQKNDRIVSIRVKESTKTALTNDVKNLNKKDRGRKISMDDLINLGRSVITPDHVQRLQFSTLTNGDKEDLIFERYCREVGAISRDEFKGKMFFGELTPFIQEQCKDFF